MAQIQAGVYTCCAVPRDLATFARAVAPPRPGAAEVPRCNADTYGFTQRLIRSYSTPR